jgi:hypothetical protein
MRHAHCRAVKAWPEVDIADIRKHLAEIPCQDGTHADPTDELVGRLLNASKLYMRTSFELGALLYRLGNRIRSRPSWWPESAGSAPAWLLAAIDREYGPDFIACRKPPAQETAAAAELPGESLGAAGAGGGGGGPDPDISALIRQLAAKKVLR